MKHLPTFDTFINEGFKKPYGEKISLDGFKAIEVDSEILYASSKTGRRIFW